MVSVQLDVPVKHALPRIWAYSYTETRLINAVARDSVQRVLRLDSESG
jgi:hypothetical protein